MFEQGDAGTVWYVLRPPSCQQFFVVLPPLASPLLGDFAYCGDCTALSCRCDRCCVEPLTALKKGGKEAGFGAELHQPGP